MSIIAANDRRGTDTQLTREVAAVRAVALLGPATGLYAACKSMLEFALAFLLSVIAAPIILLATAAIKLTSRGPALYTQTRLGKGGKPFVIYKLRTMAHNVESLTGVRWCIPNDPRVTRLGRLLRKLHIDELPQLLNVLKGEMSLIGPRPERPEFVPQLEQAIPYYRCRLQVKPGVTGLAQVQLPADTNLASVRLKLAYDLYYLRHMSFGLDLRILLSTACKLAAVPFWILRGLVGLPKEETVEREYKLLAQEQAGSAIRTHPVQDKNVLPAHLKQ